MRKLGFEETPDYDFLRELFSKVLKNMGAVDDQRYDWNELNGGRGWESQIVRLHRPPSPSTNNQTVFNTNHHLFDN